jgi:hypothetical protein
VDLSGCANIEQVYFDGTAITGVDLPKGGILKTLHLPGTLANLSLIGHPGIADFVLPSKENLSTCRLENVGGIDMKALLNSLPAGCRVRMIGFDFSVSNDSELATLKTKLDTMRGLNENGGNEDSAQILGTIRINTVTENWLIYLKSMISFPVQLANLNIFPDHQGCDSNKCRTFPLNSSDNRIHQFHISDHFCHDDYKFVLKILQSARNKLMESGWIPANTMHRKIHILHE